MVNVLSRFVWLSLFFFRSLGRMLMLSHPAHPHPAHAYLARKCFGDCGSTFKDVLDWLGHISTCQSIPHEIRGQLLHSSVCRIDSHRFTSARKFANWAQCHPLLSLMFSLFSPHLKLLLLSFSLLSLLLSHTPLVYVRTFTEYICICTCCVAWILLNEFGPHLSPSHFTVNIIQAHWTALDLLKRLPTWTMLTLNRMLWIPPLLSITLAATRLT